MGRIIILKADIKDKTHVLINVYVPNKDKDLVSFFNNLLAILQRENLGTEDNIIIGDDFNCPLNLEIDKKGGILIERKSVTAYKINSIWLIFGELKTQTQGVLPGVKSLQEFFAGLIIG